MLPNIFENAKVGDSVFWTVCGWCKIIKINHDAEFPITVEGTDGDGDEMTDTFTMCGRPHILEKFPTLFPEDKVPQYYLDLCPRLKRKVKKTLEIWANIYSDGRYCVIPSKESAHKRFCDGCIAPCVKLHGEYEVEE